MLRVGRVLVARGQLVPSKPNRSTNYKRRQLLLLVFATDLAALLRSFPGCFRPVSGLFSRFFQAFRYVLELRETLHSIFPYPRRDDRQARIDRPDSQNFLPTVPPVHAWDSRLNPLALDSGISGGRGG